MLKLPGGFGGSGKRYIVGFDIGDTSCGISYSSDHGEIRTVSLVAGSEEYVIPMALSKRHGAGQWFFGKEAFASSEAGESVLVESFFQACSILGRYSSAVIPLPVTPVGGI